MENFQLENWSAAVQKYGWLSNEKCNLHIIRKIKIRFIGARNSVYLTS